MAAFTGLTDAELRARGQRMADFPWPVVSSNSATQVSSQSVAVSESKRSTAAVDRMDDSVVQDLSAVGQHAVLNTAATAATVALQPGMYPSSSAPKTMDVINPATQEVIDSFSVSTAKEVADAIGAAVEANNRRTHRDDVAPAWGSPYNAAARSKVLTAFADRLEQDSERITTLVVQTSGMPITQASADVAECVKTFRYFAAIAGEERTLAGGKQGGQEWYTVREPLGAVGVLGVWNYPASMFSWQVAGPLAYGNTVVFKASEKATLLALEMEKLTIQVGFPPGAFKVLTGGPEVGTALVRDDGFKHRRLEQIYFTGSEATAQKVMAAALPKFIGVSAEMGGKSPHVVFDDALQLPGGLDRVCNNLMWGIFASAGQSCSAGSRIMVQSGIYDQVKRRLVEMTQKTMVMGDPLDATTTMGPVVDAKQFKHVMGMLNNCKQGIADGRIPGRILCGGEAGPAQGFYIQPTLIELDDPSETAPIVTDEIFGPVATLQKFDTDEQAIAMANNTRYGLAAGVMTSNQQRASAFSDQVNAGVVWEQSYGVTPIGQPFAGWGQSSFGSRNSAPTGAKTSEDHYTRSKTVSHALSDTLA